MWRVIMVAGLLMAGFGAGAEAKDVDMSHLFTANQTKLTERSLTWTCLPRERLYCRKVSAVCEKIPDDLAIRVDFKTSKMGWCSAEGCAWHDMRWGNGLGGTKIIALDGAGVVTIGWGSDAEFVSLLNAFGDASVTFGHCVQG